VYVLLIGLGNHRQKFSSKTLKIDRPSRNRLHEGGLPKIDN